MGSELLMAVAILIIKYGVPATIAIIKEWDVDNPTIEDIKALKEMVPPPETYFEEPEPTL